MKHSKLIVVILSLIMVFSLAACNEGPRYVSTDSSSVPSENTGNLQSERSEQSQLNTETGNKNVDKTPSEKDQTTGGDIPTDDDTTMGTAALTDITVGSDSFKQAFEINPIDEEFNDSFQIATSNQKIIEAITTATDKWSGIVNSVYQQALDTSHTEDSRSEVESMHSDWTSGLDSQLQEFEGSSESAFSSAFLKLNYYRAHVAELSSFVYNNSGELPSFESTGAAAG